MSHNYSEPWNGRNAYWDYDDDDDFITNPGALSIAVGASSTGVDFNGGPNFDEWPHTINNNYPLRIKHTAKTFCNGAGSFSLFLITFNAPQPSGNLVTINFMYLPGDGYFLDIFGTRGEGGLSRGISTGILFQGERDFTMEVIVTSSSYTILLNGVQVDYLDGFIFPSISETNIILQHTNASNTARLLESQIYTMQPGPSKYLNLLRLLLPRGPLWSNRNNIFELLLDALAQEPQRVEDRAIALMNEAFPGTSVELLADWERVALLPDEQPASGDSLATRQAVVGAKVTTLYSGPTESFFIAYALKLGITITISQSYSPFRVGTGRAGDNLNTTGGVFIWTVTVISDPNTRLAKLQQAFARLKPAHTDIVYA